MGNPIDQLLSHLRSYDACDLLATFAALQLVPENARYLPRLEAYCHVAASMEPGGRHGAITYDELVELFTEDTLGGLIGYAEDPPESLFTETIPFEGGGYVVLPGMSSDSPFELKQLCKAIFLRRDPYPDIGFTTKVRRMIRASLHISDAVARKAGLRRGMEPSSSEQDMVQIPPPAELEALKNAVMFEVDELAHVVAHLQGMCIDLQSARLHGEDYRTTPFVLRPVVRHSRGYTVVFPAEMLFALVREIVRETLSSEQQHSLCDAYSDAIWHSLCATLGYTHNVPACGFPLPPMDIPYARDGVFYLDEDKALYVIQFVDSLESYSVDDVDAFCHRADLAQQIEVRVLAAEKSVYQTRDGVNSVMALVIYQGLGRGLAAGFGTERMKHIPSVHFNAEELENVAWKSMGNPLALWDYALAIADCESQGVSLLQSSSLDQYEWYRRERCTFYSSDEQRPTSLIFMPGIGAELRRQVSLERDVHSVASYNDNFSIEVTRLHSQDIPIYVPSSSHDQRIAIYVNDLPLPIWVIGPDCNGDTEGDDRSLYLQLCDAIAYWVWQFTPLLDTPLRSLNQIDRCLRMHIVLAHTTDLPSDSEALPFDVMDMARVMPCKESLDLSIELDSRVSRHLMCPDNRGERELVRIILKGLRGLLEDDEQGTLSDSRIATAIEEFAPLGPKKKIFALDAARTPALCPLSSPSYRKISRAAENRLLDRLGEYLIEEENYAVGTIPQEQCVSLVNLVVEFLYRLLSARLATLQPRGLLEWLISHHEALTREAALQRITAVTGSACFGDTPARFERVKDQLTEFSAVRLANRFLIEYVVAKPPSGLRPMSYSVYDEVLAAASLIIDYGALSDVLHYRLAEVNLSILPSGRLGQEGDVFLERRGEYLDVYTSGQLYRGNAGFGRFWRASTGNADEASEQLLEDLDIATEAEWGIALSDIILFIGTVVQTDLKEEVPAISEELALFVTRFARTLKWSEDKVRQVLERLCLQERSDFLDPAPPDTKEEVYPWRLDRTLSLVHRPFLIAKTERGKQVFYGFRHLSQTAEYLQGWVTSGRCIGKSQEMKSLNGRINKWKGEDFNRKVAQHISSFPSVEIKTGVKKAGKLHVPGDIDVLAMTPQCKKIWVIECKDFEMARTPFELNGEMRKFFDGEGSGKSMIDKHLRRVAWVKSHMAQALSLFNVTDFTDWSVRDFVVTNDELMSPFLRRCPVTVISYAQLCEKGLP